MSKRFELHPDTVARMKMLKEVQETARATNNSANNTESDKPSGSTRSRNSQNPTTESKQ